MNQYVALLRGINVGGKSLIKMAALKECLDAAGFEDVRTYIQSGNVLFKSSETNEDKLAEKIRATIKNTFSLDVPTVVISHARFKGIIKNFPKNWGENKEWKYNTLFLIPPYDLPAIIEMMGVLKPDIEALAQGDGVLYQGVELKMFGRSTTGKLAANPSYKFMTIRNLNTTRKLLELMNDSASNK